MPDNRKDIAVAIKNLANQFQRYTAKTKAIIDSKIKDVKNVTDIQGRIISYLHAHLAEKEVYQKDIEKCFNIRRSTATVILKRMEKNGLITRETCDTDGRLKKLVLTQKSKNVYPIAHAEILKAGKQAVQGLTDEEIDIFLKVIERVSENIS